MNASWRQGAWAIGLSVVVACGGSEGSDTVDAAGPVDDAGLSRVTGSVGYDYHSTNGVERVPTDLSAVAVAAWLPRADGTYAKIDGQGFADGTFVIDDVPEHLVYIQVGDDYVGTASRVVDLGRDVLGRADLQYASPGTRLVFDVDNLRPWSDSDSLLLASENALVASYFDFAATAPIAPGSTSLAANEFEWYWLIDDSAGDRVSIYQIDQRSLDGIWYEVAVRSFDAPPFAVADANTTVVSGSFGTLAEDQRLDLDWNAGAYAFQARDVNSEAFDVLGEVGLFARPPGSGVTFGLDRAPVVRFPFVFSDEVVAAAGMPYSDPYPAAWPRYVSACMLFGAEYTLLGTEPGLAFAEIVYSAPYEDLPDGAVSVRMSPVSALLVNDLPGRVSRSDVTTTPTLTWNEPSIGVSPSGYRVAVLMASIVNGQTEIAYAGPTFYTTERSLTLPAGIVADAGAFVVRVTAIWAPNGEISSSPLRETLPYAKSEALTGLLTP